MATQELLNDKKDIGSWGKALMESEGNTDLANGLYVKHRVQKLQDEISEDLIKKAQDKLAKEKLAKEIEFLESQSEAQLKTKREADREEFLWSLKHHTEKSDNYYDQQVTKLMKKFDIPIESDLRAALGIKLEWTNGEWKYNGHSSFRGALVSLIEKQPEN